jgi:hypothetical protein
LYDAIPGLLSKASISNTTALVGNVLESRLVLIRDFGSCEPLHSEYNLSQSGITQVLAEYIFWWEHYFHRHGYGSDQSAPSSGEGYWEPQQHCRHHCQKPNITEASHLHCNLVPALKECKDYYFAFSLTCLCIYVLVICHLCSNHTLAPTNNCELIFRCVHQCPSPLPPWIIFAFPASPSKG